MSKRSQWISGTAFVLILAGAAALLIRGCSSPDPHEPWRGAYMNTFATNGEIINVLKNTNACELCGVQVSEWKAFPFAPPINERAQSGGLDIVPEGVVPTASLLAADPKNWRVVARLIYFPIVIMAREGSGIETLKDLRGKRIGTPFGSGAHPPVVEALESAGLTVKDVELLNLGIPEQIEALAAGRIDAVGTWEPQVAVMTERKLARPIATYNHVAFILLRKSRIDANRQDAINVLKAFVLANWYAANHPKEVRAWFAEDSRFSEDLLARMKVTEPNMSVKSLAEVDITLKDEDLEQGNRYARFMLDHKLLPSPVDFRSLADLDLAREAQEQLKKENFDPTRIKALR